MALLGLSKIMICNMALSRLGERLIATENEETKEAQVCDAFYENVRRELLCDFDWRFALVYATLTQLSVTSPVWEYMYQLPTDCLLVRRVFPVDASGKFMLMKGLPPVEYEKIGDRIGCRVTPLGAAYTTDVSVPAQMDPLFVEAFSWKLAGAACMGLSASDTKLELCLKGYSDALERAKYASAVQAQDELEFSHNYPNSYRQ